MKLKNNKKNQMQVKDDSRELADNLRALLRKSHLNPSQLAQTLGIPLMTVRRLISGETADPRISTLKLMANHFDVSIDSLIENTHHASIKLLKNNKSLLIPILDWDAIKNFRSIEEIDLKNWEKWIPISLNSEQTLSKKSFALESRPSMYPRFPIGTTFVIDPTVTIEDGDTVLVKIKSNGEITLRELVIDPPEWRLLPTIAGSDVVKYSEKEHEILGVNMLKVFYGRK